MTLYVSLHRSCCAIQHPCPPGEVGQAPPVWYQLLLRCINSPQCCQALLSREAEVLQELQAAGCDTAPILAALDLERSCAAADAISGQA